VNALFLGPQSENREIFQRLISFLVDKHIHWRRNFHPGDRPIIILEEQRTPEYERTIELTQRMLLRLSSELKVRSMPWFSPRYLGHMTYDPMMAASLAHIAALLYNPNNVAREGAPATTWMEVEVGQQLATLFGYGETDEGEVDKGVQPWGHITSGGTVANFEGLWIAKTMKSIPLAIHACEHDERLPAQLKKKPVSEKYSRWQLRTLSPTATLNLLDSFLGRSKEAEHRPQLLQEVLDRSARGLGVHRHASTSDDEGHAGVVLVPQSRHYSWDKAIIQFNRDIR
jgi:hypothetical protein